MSVLDQQKNQHTVSFRFDPSGIRSVSDAFSQLRSDNERLRSTLTMGAQVNTPDFLDWIADRLVNVHAEPANVDFVLSLRERASAMRAALASDAEQAA